MPSTGLHTNGYSLARKLFFEVAGYTPETYVSEIRNKAGAELMRTHKSYWPMMRRLVEAEDVVGMAHITGGGITENLPRVLPKGTSRHIANRIVAGAARVRLICRSSAMFRRKR